jgi:DNA polymerase I
VEGPEDPPDVFADEVWSLVDTPERTEATSFPRLRIMSFYIIPLGRSGAPRPKLDPIAAITVNNSERKPSRFIAEGDADGKMLASFVEYVGRYDPDIIVGYGVNQRDWQLLTARAQHLGFKLEVGRDRSSPHTSVYGHTSITGRIGLDLLDVAKEMPELDPERLGNLAHYLGISFDEELMGIEEVDLADLWVGGERQRVLAYATQNAMVIIGAANSLLEPLTQLSDLVKIPLDHVMTAAVGFRVEAFLMAFAHGFGELIPRRGDRDYAPYAGGLVLSPKPGVHEDIAVLDFRSMYPSLMIKYNLSPDTYVKKGGEDLNLAPEVGHGFRKGPAGFYKEALTSLIRARGDLAQRLKGLKPRTTEYKLLEARQRAIKIIQ